MNKVKEALQTIESIADLIPDDKSENPLIKVSLMAITALRKDAIFVATSSAPNIALPRLWKIIFELQGWIKQYQDAKWAEESSNLDKKEDSRRTEELDKINKSVRIASRSIWITLASIILSAALSGASLYCSHKDTQLQLAQAEKQNTIGTIQNCLQLEKNQRPSACSNIESKINF